MRGVFEHLRSATHADDDRVVDREEHVLEQHVLDLPKAARALQVQLRNLDAKLRDALEQRLVAAAATSAAAVARRGCCQSRRPTALGVAPRACTILHDDVQAEVHRVADPVVEYCAYLAVPPVLLRVALDVDQNLPFAPLEEELAELLRAARNIDDELPNQQEKPVKLLRVALNVERDPTQQEELVELLRVALGLEREEHPDGNVPPVELADLFAPPSKKSAPNTQTWSYLQQTSSPSSRAPPLK